MTAIIGNEFARLASEANCILKRNARRTDYTRRRLLALSMLGTSNDPMLTVRLVMDCDIRTARRFIDQVRGRGIAAAYHGNLERRTHEQAFQLLREALHRLPRGSRVSSPKVVRWLQAQGITAPSERLVRWWIRELFRRKRRRSRRRRGGL